MLKGSVRKPVLFWVIDSEEAMEQWKFVRKMAKLIGSSR